MKKKIEQKFYQPNSNTLYNALLSKDKAAVNQFLKDGEKIPEFLYMQITNHDNLSILQFLLSFQPEKQLDALKQSFIQGAVECFQYLATLSSKVELKALSTINPRRNTEAIKALLECALCTKSPETVNLFPIR